MDKDFRARIENAKSDEELAALKAEMDAELAKLKGIEDILSGNQIEIGGKEEVEGEEVEGEEE
ncbi:hypothetical protein [Paenibacillus xylanilyticus]|uniref:Uncharacterized protein n=1 Tax=Paenibacillus xylanilyticus TaxID=248903 RepID=A0A7Y6EVJ5_9BACL|nr:hypothetical protein [Paenibacillus xylanilyticus]NUU75758.1 hypothetical protein [Paenibacillus xylanilyticus]